MANIQMTERQRIAVNNIFRMVEKNNKGKELKNWKVEVEDWGYGSSSKPQVFVTVEYGYEGDENKLSSLYCRDRRFIFIGTKGGCTLLNALRRKDREGIWNAVNGITESFYNRKRRNRKSA